MCLHKVLHNPTVLLTESLQGHSVLEMPSGTGKTVSLLSLIVAYLLVSQTYTSHAVWLITGFSPVLLSVVVLLIHPF